MFSFHKPKIYRSNLGCCICKAKSSSSRFTDSKKYENEFERCFRIQEKRSGEICNACVLLVKRWKKLSPENRITKHWHHVVDARAGPGTKLTGNRRLVGSSSSGSGGGGGSRSSNSNIDSQDCSSSSNTGTNVKQRTVLSSRVEVLPLSSRDQANNQASSSATSASGASSSTSSSAARRSNSFSNKARAIDTNVTTFTFGEPDNRRSYMSSSSYYATSPTSSSSHLSFAKPQSALNSSAFESVIKRFRQRQQQQQMAAQRRQQNRQQRLLQQQQQQSPQSSERTQKFVSRKQLPSQRSEESSECSSQSEQKAVIDSQQLPQAPHLQVPPGKRLKRSSESINSVTIDGVKASSILDSSLWRKEKVCCGIIFRGLYNEVVVFPKLLKPCQCRTNALKLKLRAIEAEEDEDQEEEELVEQQSVDSPLIRATKSGSISSCDSNTSGTGSMEPQLEDMQKKRNDQILNAVAKQRRKSNLRSLTSATESGEESGVCSGPLIAGDLSQVTASNAKQLQQQTSSTIELSHPRLLTSKRNQQQQISATNKRTKRLNDNDSTISSSSSATQSSRVASDCASQQAHSPGSSSDGSSSRLLLMADEDVALAMLDDEDIESNTDASSSVESIAEVERKKSSGVVGAMG